METLLQMKAERKRRLELKEEDEDAEDEAYLPTYLPTYNGNARGLKKMISGKK